MLNFKSITLWFGSKLEAKLNVFATLSLYGLFIFNFCSGDMTSISVIDGTLIICTVVAMLSSIFSFLRWKLIQADLNLEKKEELTRMLQWFWPIGFAHIGSFAFLNFYFGAEIPLSAIFLTCAAVVYGLIKTLPNFGKR